VTPVQAFAAPGMEPPVRGFLHLPEEPGSDALVLTHSAGANCQAPLLVAVAEALAAAGVTVLRCDLPFRQERPSGPPLRTATRDQAGLRSAVEALRAVPNPPARIFLGGHSYGGRMASMLAAAEPGLVHGLLLLSYPLHPARQPAQLRTQHFPSLQTPTLLISGVRDGFGTIAELEAACRLIPAPTRLVPVEGAGHELLRKASQDAVTRLVVEAFEDFTAPLAGPDSRA
jgi:uncharacterized protein